MRFYRVLSFGAGLSEVVDSVRFAVNVLNGGEAHAMPRARRDRVFMQSLPRVDKADILTDPVVHVVAVFKKPAMIQASTYRRKAGRTVKLVLECPARDWKTFKPAFFKIAAGMSIDLPAWPPTPPGRKNKLKNGILFSGASDIKKKQMQEIQKCTFDVQKAMVSVHGPIRRPQDEPLVVYVHQLMAEHKRIASTDEVSEVVYEPSWHRMFTVPIGERGAANRQQFVGSLAVMILGDFYGLEQPPWFGMGERIVASQRDSTKKKLPTATKAMLEELKAFSKKFAKLQTEKHSPAPEYQAQCFAYIAMFHAGPPQYRKAYRAFLAELRKTFDAAEATRKHLLSLDQARLLKDVKTFISKLRGVHVRVK